MAESFAELFEKSIETTELKPGAIIKAEVIEIGKEFVVLNAGLKSEGFIPVAQFTNDKGEITINIGDEVEVALEALENGHGETQISHEKAQRIRTWEILEQKFRDEETITGVVSSRVKGGFTVDVESVKAFLPGSLVDVRPVKDPSIIEGKEIEFKIIKLDQKRNNIVISRRAVLEKEYKEEREEVLKNLQEGDVVKAVVKNLTDYGAFLDLGGVDGLLHITDMAWKRVKYPSEVVEIGQEVEVKVLKFDRERGRVSLGMKQLGDDPWADIAQRYPANSTLSGKITNIADYGAFVEIEDGVEGLVHVSEMDWTNKNVNPRKFVSVGQEVEVMILEIDGERRRISLGMKQCQPNPWEEFGKHHNQGEHVKGQIKSITDFGIFIGLDGGIDGLVHLSDLSWDESGEEAVRAYQKGQEVEAIILGIDAERERISLGVKQLKQDTFSQFTSANGRGAIVKGKVIEVDERQAVVELAEGINGILKASEASIERVEDLSKLLSVGDEVEAKVLNVDRKNKNLSLSVRAKDVAEEKAVIQDYTRKESQAGTSLGDIFKELENSDN
ncbi:MULTISPECIES: 30S ribosomal protein S1 [Pseudomonadota]|uniref:30S ribosomal protein S1 n=2 Tax=Pseudomonadota TaxID=1224 RepID=A0A380MLY8_9GAMM|nr:30S ribosomal protein S1 [Suttonella indologenes]SPU57704.1 30S ribosomal protein S1 [Brevundimonas vesicularis]SUO92572.1 30S ribosomal protein S1 [Suttonella indologenes]